MRMIFRMIVKCSSGLCAVLVLSCLFVLIMLFVLYSFGWSIPVLAVFCFDLPFFLFYSLFPISLLPQF